MKRTLYTLFFCVMAWVQWASADDVAIYGTQSVNLKPNVLIIFDNSGSMNEKDVPKPKYDPTIPYDGGYTKYKANAVYEEKYDHWAGHYWSKLTDDIENILCKKTKEALKTNGYTRDFLKPNLTCGGRGRRLRTGNFLNYDNSENGQYASRLSVAKQVVISLLRETDKVLFGLMVFNHEHGGRLVEACGSTLKTDGEGNQIIDNTNIIDAVRNLIANAWTPLAETMAEAGRYFRGGHSYFNGDFRYTSPITETCQKNYVIIITDGAPTKDDAPILYSPHINYMNGNPICDYSNGGHYLDDVTAFLFEEDVHAMGAGTSYAKQNIITHTIGFRLTHPLLSSAAKRAGGDYYTANTSSALKEAFEQILNTIAEESSVFVAPVVPVNRTNPTQDSKHIYLAFFKPQQSGEWLGNLKKYNIGANGKVLDAFHQLAANENGELKENIRSLWTTAAQNDGNQVTLGGFGERILAQKRNIYTYQGSNPNLTHNSNQFIKSNNITYNTTAIPDDQIDAVRNGNANWQVGAIIHSTPVVVHYTNGAPGPEKSVIFFGTNDGLLRCVDDYNGKELWSFVPPEQLDRLNLLLDDNHDYYMDGSPSIGYGELIEGKKLFQPKLLAIGERRGGNHYYVLDIETITSPKWKYQINPDILGAATDGGETLGQSWGTPTFCKIKKNATETEEVILLPGGYDSQQDLQTPEATDSVGRALFGVKQSDGTLSSFNLNHGNWDLMTHSITALNAIDHDIDGITTRIYAGDMGGNVFVISDDITLETQGNTTVALKKTPDGTWSYKKRLFTTGGTKIFYAPVSAKMKGSQRYLFFGTGNRENPFELTEKNAIYAIKHNWLNENLTKDDLTQIQNTDQNYAQDIVNSKGWYLKFTHRGEKLISPLHIYTGRIIFNTYTPPATTSDAPLDPCSGAGARGQGRKYTIQ
ncbi:MAG: hypothetical protein MI742_10710, partial [Desulfobacterales bacterium]|nr:hypothetical protein [Desulfobacterales bacterium]